MKKEGSFCMENDSCKDQVVAMAYVPWQNFYKVYEPEKALMIGTIFPELNKPFLERRMERK